MSVIEETVDGVTVDNVSQKRGLLRFLVRSKADGEEILREHWSQEAGTLRLVAVTRSVPPHNEQLRLF